MLLYELRRCRPFCRVDILLNNPKMGKKLNGHFYEPPKNGDTIKISRTGQNLPSPVKISRSIFCPVKISHSQNLLDCGRF